MRTECQKRGIKKEPFITSRVTQVYDNGACVYIYLGFMRDDLPDPLHTFEEIEMAARQEIVNSGGALSHHHGVGKLRKMFMDQNIGDNGLELLRGVKQKLDPQNIFAVGNLF